MTENPEQQAPEEEKEPQEEGFPRPTAQFPGKIENIQRAVAARREYFRGQIRVPTPPRVLRMPSGKEITLPRTPTDWNALRRLDENFLTGQPEHLSRYDELSERERLWISRFAGAPDYPIVQWGAKLLENIGDIPVAGPALEWLGKGAIDALNWSWMELERHLGYAAQHLHDPDLRTAEAMEIYRRPDLRWRLRRNPEMVESLSPIQRKAWAAWQASDYFYQAAPIGYDEWASLFKLFAAGAPAIEAKEAPEEAPFWKRFRLTYPLLQVFEERIKNGTFFAADKIGPYERAWMERYGIDIVFGEEYYEDSARKWRAFLDWQNDPEEAGLSELIKLRQDLINGADLETAYAAYIERSGALAFRGQINEILMAIALDPMNYIMPYLRPVERLHALRQTLLFNRVAPEVMQAAEELKRAASLVDQVDDFARFADDIARIGEKMAVEGVEEIVENVKNMAKAGVSDAAEYQKALAPLDDIVSRLDELKDMPRYGRFIIALTGGDPLHPTFGAKRFRLNPLALSATARVNEYLDTVYNNLSIMLRMADGVEGSRGMVAIFKRAAAGAFGKTFGHMFVSPIGRHVQAVYRYASSKIDDLLLVYQQTKPLVARARTFASLLGEDLVEMVTRLGESADEAQAILKAAIERLDELAAAGQLTEAQRLLRQAIRQRRFGVDDLVEIGAMLKSTPDKIIPYTPELFRAAMMNEVVEAAAKLGELHFGIQEMRWLEKGANYLKAAESLLLLGFNPKYPIQNFFNNEVTMVARGLYGLILPDFLSRKIPATRKIILTVEDYFRSHGYEPARLFEGYGIVGPDMLEEAGEFMATKAERQALIRGRQIVRQTLWGPQPRLGRKFLDFTRNIKGFRQVSAAMERWARQRSMMIGHMKAWNQLWRPGKAFSRLDDFRPSLAARLAEHDDELPRIIEDLAAASRQPKDFDSLAALEDLQLNAETIFRRTAEELGLDVTEMPEIVGFDVQEAVRARLAELPARPNVDQIQGAYDDIRDIVQVNLDEAFRSHIPTMLEESIAKVEANGPRGVISIYGEISDALYARHESHMMRLDERIAQINLMTDPVLKDRAWKILLEEADIAWARYWDMEEAMRKGIVRGLERRGISVPDEFMGSFKKLRGESQSFIDLRNKLWSQHFDQIVKGKFSDDVERMASAAAIYERLDGEYHKLIELTEAAHLQMDEVFLGSAISVKDEMLDAAIEWRRIVRAMRRQDMENVLEFRRSIRGLRDVRTINEAWRDFHQNRIRDMARINQMEKYGQLMLDGDENAVQFFLQNARARAQRAELEVPVIVRRVQERAQQIAENPALRTPLERTLSEFPGIGATTEDQANLARQLSDPEMLDEVRLTQQRTQAFLRNVTEGDTVTIYRSQRGRSAGEPIEEFVQPAGTYDMQRPDQRTMPMEARPWEPEEPYHYTRAQLQQKLEDHEAGRVAVGGSARRDAILNLRWEIDRHKSLVDEALREGKYVPPEVIAEYPDIQKSIELSQNFRGLAPIIEENTERFGQISRYRMKKSDSNGYMPQIINGEVWWTDGIVLFKGEPPKKWDLNDRVWNFRKEIDEIFSIEDPAERMRRWEALIAEGKYPNAKDVLDQSLKDGDNLKSVRPAMVISLGEEAFDPKNATVVLATEDGSLATFINARFYNEAVKRYGKDLTFVTVAPDRPVIVYAEGKPVAVIMPLDAQYAFRGSTSTAEIGLPVYPPLAEGPAGAAAFGRVPVPDDIKNLGFPDEVAEAFAWELRAKIDLLEANRGPPGLEGAQARQEAEKYSRGASMQASQVYKEYGVTRDEIRAAMKRAGMPVTPREWLEGRAPAPRARAPQLEPINQAVGQWLAENVPNLTEEMQEPIGRFLKGDIDAEAMLAEIEARIPDEAKEAFRAQFIGVRRVVEGEPGLPSWQRLLQGNGDWSIWSFDGGIAGQHPGDLYEVEVPIENVFAIDRTHAGLMQHAHEQPAILSDDGLRGARLVSINGEAPPAEIAAEFERLPPRAEDLFKGIEFGEEVPSLPDFDGVVGKQMYVGLGADELWFEKGSSILDEMERQTIAMLDRPALRLERLPEDLQQEVMNYFQHVTGQMNDAELASIRIAEGLSDAALLNYNRRYNIDNWMGIMMPFHFWFTHSAVRWALHSIDRPAMLSSFIKIRHFLNSVMGENRGFPSRLRGHVKLPIPFAPKEFGEIWIDPLRAFGLPFEQFTQPFEWMAQNKMWLESRIRRKLDDMVEQGQITEQEKKAALANPSSPLYQRARQMVLAEDDNLSFDIMDFMNLSASPHLPLQMAWNIARGRPEKIAPLPHTRALRNLSVLLGVEPGVYDNVWGNVRKAIGLAPFDEFESYRIEREVSTMAGENLITADEAIEAMINHEGPAWEEARKRSAKMEAAAWAANTIGIPAKPYPEGERHLRELYDQFYKALNLRDRGDATAVKDFFEQHPEFEARLALFDDPETRLKQFLVDQIWDRYNGLDSLGRREAREALGPQFQELFLNPNTRSTDALTPEVLAMWTRMLGGSDPGNLAPTALPIPLTDRMTAKRMEAFYDYRRRFFPEYYDLQKDYFKLEKGDARRAFLRQNPGLQAYWDWRRDFMYRNPDLAPYIEDDPDKLPNYGSIEELQQIQAAEPSYTWGEWTRIIVDHGGESMMNLIVDYYQNDLALPDITQRDLDKIGANLGIGGWREVLARMEESMQIEEQVPSGLTEPYYQP